MRSWRHSFVFKKLNRRDGSGEFRLLGFLPKLIHFVRIDSLCVAIPNVSHARKWYAQPLRSAADGCLHLVPGWTRFTASISLAMDSSPRMSRVGGCSDPNDQSQRG
jgi:hypothetical protein